MNKNIKSLAIHIGIILLGSLVTALPEINVLIAKYLSPERASFIIIMIGTFLKKIYDEVKEKKAIE